MDPTGGGPNWLGLLKWSLMYSDGTAPSDVKPMTKEDQEFLLNVMNELVQDDPKRMREIMVNIATYLEESVEESKSCSDVEEKRQDTGASRLAAIAAAESFRRLNRDEQDKRIEQELEDLQDIVEQIDMAEVFIKNMKGEGCLLDIAENRKGLVGRLSVRSKATVILGTLSQNNTKVQEVLFQNGTVSRLVSFALSLLSVPPALSASVVLPTSSSTLSKLFQLEQPVLDGRSVGFHFDDSSSTSRYTLLSKVISALSCTIRSYAPAEDGFIRGMGHQGLLLLQAILSPGTGAARGSETSSGRDEDLSAADQAWAICRSKAVFLANALLGSDSLGAESKRELLQTVVPRCYLPLLASSISDSDVPTSSVFELEQSSNRCKFIGWGSAELRDHTLKLLLSAIRLPGQVGVSILSGTPIASSLEPQINLRDVLIVRARAVTTRCVSLRRKQAENSLDSSVAEELGQCEAELSRLQVLRLALAEPSVPVATPASTTSSAAKSQQLMQYLL